MRIFNSILSTPLLSVIFIATIGQLNAQVPKVKNGIEYHAPGFTVRIQFYDESIVRVTKWISPNAPTRPSLSVIKNPDADLGVEVEEEKGEIEVSSKRLSVRLGTPGGGIEFRSPAQKGAILSEKGTPEFAPVVYDGDSGCSVRQDFQLSEGEGVYGLGQQQSGEFNFRGKRVILVQSNTEDANPFLVSTKNYGILWDNYSKTVFDDKPDGASLWSDVADAVDYYFVSGANIDSVIAGYRELTGQAPMYGKWAFGYWQSKEHYKTEDEVLAVAAKYRALNMPIDNIIQDWDYWNGAANWGGMFFDKSLYPEPKKMCDSLHAMNFHIIISIWPALGPNTPVYADMLSHGFLYKPVGWAGFKYYDAFNPAANDLYCRYLDDGLYSQGLDGWWIDSSEPDVVNAMTTASSEYELKKMGSNHLGSWARYLNAYPLVMTSAIYKNWRNETSDRRAYILTRSMFAGQQRNAATTWTGDIGASWEVYRKQIASGLNHCMSGIPYWTFDIGGFVLGAYDGVFMNGGKDPPYQELYARMFQFGVFSPIFRSHGSETPREIWEMGEFTQPILRADELRYRLLPYIYSLSHDVTANGYTIMRGLPMDFENDARTYSIGDQYMFGPSLMVCPVTEFMYYRPPQQSVLVGPEFFRTDEGAPGLRAKYYKDNTRKSLSRDTIDANIDFTWYTGRPPYVTDSMYAVQWRGKLVPLETGKYQFHLVSYDPKRIILDGDTLKMVYTSVEQYTEPVELIAGKEYTFVAETENNSTGAAKMRLFWKTPSIFAKEQSAPLAAKVRAVYLPANNGWYDFWTGVKYNGGSTVKVDAPIERIPLFVRAGSIVPMGPFLHYATEKPADPLELRIYPGADAQFTLYEDENDNYDYEKGVFSTITFRWNDAQRRLTVGERKGAFPGMLGERTIDVVVAGESHGTGLGITAQADRVIKYTGSETSVTLP